MKQENGKSKKTIVHKKNTWHTTACGKKCIQMGRNQKATWLIENKAEWPSEIYSLCTDCWERYNEICKIE